MTNNPPSAQIKPGEYGFPLKLKARYDNFIGGEWVAPADGEYYQNLTPVTGQLLCEVASSGKRDIDLALDAAHKVKDKWRTPRCRIARRFCLRLPIEWNKTSSC